MSASTDTASDDPADSSRAGQTPAVGIRGVLAGQTVRTVWQPVVDLETSAVVAFEALSRGPADSPLERPDLLFDAARADGSLDRLDGICRTSAFRSANALDLSDPWTVFVNVEPEVLDTAHLGELRAIARAAPRQLRIVLEITERALATRPAQLLRTLEGVRELGWGIALDDVGVDPASLTFMALLRPDVVKLDLSLVQRAPSSATAEVMNAVNAYAEASGALILAEGIETEQHLTAALALGATLGQGWLYGRPTDAPPTATTPDRFLRLLPPRPAQDTSATSPFAALPDDVALRRSPKRLLIELSKNLEREARRWGHTCLVASTFQYARHFTPATAVRYQDLVDHVGLVCALGMDLTPDLLPGLRGGPLGADDPVMGEWDVVVLSPHFSAALLARDLGDTGPETDRTFEYALTYDRDTVTRAAHSLLSRVAPLAHA